MLDFFALGALDLKTINAVLLYCHCEDRRSVKIPIADRRNLSTPTRHFDQAQRVEKSVPHHLGGVIPFELALGPQNAKRGRRCVEGADPYNGKGENGLLRLVTQLQNDREENDNSHRKGQASHRMPALALI